MVHTVLRPDADWEEKEKIQKSNLFLWPPIPSRGFPFHGRGGRHMPYVGRILNCTITYTISSKKCRNSLLGNTTGSPYTLWTLYENTTMYGKNQRVSVLYIFPIKTRLLENAICFFFYFEGWRGACEHSEGEVCTTTIWGKGLIMETDNSVTKISEDERVVPKKCICISFGRLNAVPFRQFLYFYTFLITEYGFEYFAIESILIVV